MKNRYGSPLVLKALEFFVENPYKEVYLREFARELKINSNTAQRFLEAFLNEGLVIESKKAHLRYFKANIESLSFRHIKIVFSLKQIENSGIISKLKEDGVSHAILFGSIAYGLDDSKSDLDLVIIGGNKTKILDLIREFEKKISKEVNSHLFSWAEWKKQQKENKAFYLDIISKGINLIGEKPILE